MGSETRETRAGVRCNKGAANICAAPSVVCLVLRRHFGPSVTQVPCRLRDLSLALNSLLPPSSPSFNSNQPGSPCDSRVPLDCQRRCCPAQCAAQSLATPWRVGSSQALSCRCVDPASCSDEHATMWMRSAVNAKSVAFHASVQAAAAAVRRECSVPIRGSPTLEKPTWSHIDSSSERQVRRQHDVIVSREMKSRLERHAQYALHSVVLTDWHSHLSIKMTAPPVSGRAQADLQSMIITTCQFGQGSTAELIY